MKKSIPLYLPLCFLLLLTTCISPLIQATEKEAEVNNVTGTWYTNKKFSYLVDRSENQPFAAPNIREKVPFHERYMTVEWQLVQRPDGIITGTSKWTSYDKNKKKLLEGTDILLGGINHDRIIITDTSDRNSQLIFDFTLDDNNNMSGFGYNIIGPKEIMMRFELVRKK
ncbi:hypothetical protein [uncultured Shewanella sp.]|uniref:hypothetical protein n=1 Tax=uncultured Shewanella sp. TaxID=173975 RepID=UPI00262E025A|nr:hypothetical protein [uncultured Shewanella sp.]